MAAEVVQVSDPCPGGVCQVRPVSSGGSARIREIKAEYLAEFYRQHPEKRPAQAPSSSEIVNSFLIKSHEDVRELAIALLQMLDQADEIEVRVMGAV